jgi:hypothetical protein
MTADLWAGAEVEVARTVHGLRELMRGWDRAKLAAYEAADRVMLRCFADRVIAVSAHAAESLRRSWVWQSPIAQIHNGVNLQYLAGWDREWAGRIHLGHMTIAAAIDVPSKEGARELLPERPHGS